MRVHIQIENEMGAEVDIDLTEYAQDIFGDEAIGQDERIIKNKNQHLAGMFIDASARAVKAIGIESYLEVSNDV